MPLARIREKKSGNVLVRDPTSEPVVVACYLFQETDLQAKFQGEFPIVTIKTLDSLGRAVEKPALRVTFPHDQSIEEPVGLLGFGSDPRCHVLLPAGVVGPVHCRVFAQLNSGPHVWVVDDTSTQGTGVQDDDTLRDSSSKVVLGRRQAARGLRSLTIGPYRFQIRPPTSNAEIARRDDWFSLNKAIPVTQSMLDRQLGGVRCNWLRKEFIAEGGNAKVYKYMETNTALYIAVKEQKVDDDKHKALALKEIQKEINFMKTLRHPCLVELLFDESDNKPQPTICTAMPLYLGDLRSILPLPRMQTTEQIMLQIAEGLRFMHSNMILHRDLKPANILVVSPERIKIADLGWAAYLDDTDSLHGVCGTVAYCAPEALWTKDIHTPAIDVYSLGAVFFMMLDLEKVDRGWVERLFHGKPDLFNTAFENARHSPPRGFPGLVQSMLDPNRRGRCSLDECIEIVKAQKYGWTNQTPLIATAGTTNLAAVHQGTQNTTHNILQQTPFGKARARINMPKPTPAAQIKWPEEHQSPHQAPVKLNLRYWRPALQRQDAAALVHLALRMQKPQSKPACVQGIDFNARLPSYEEATNQNPFAGLALQGGKKKKSSHHGPNLSNIHPAYRPKEPLVQRAPAPVAHNKQREKSVRIEASSVARAALLPNTHGRQPRNSRQPVPRSQNRALNLHRARDARIHRQADRQEAREKRKAKLTNGLRKVAAGTFDVVTALLGFACDGLVVGGERVFDRFKNNRAAREALEHVVANVNADARLVASVQRHAAAGGRLRSASRMCTAEMLDRQLMLSRRR